MKKAIWGEGYDLRTDKAYKCPVCPDCQEEIARLALDGSYYCFNCWDKVEVDDPEMLEWLKQRAETKTEIEKCFKCGEMTCETRYRRNRATLEWEAAFGKCSKCGLRFIV